MTAMLSSFRLGWFAVAGGAVMVVRDVLPDGVVVLLSAAARPLGYQFAVASHDVAAIVAARGVVWPLVREPHRTPDGVQCAVLPLAAVAAVAVREAPSIAHALDEPVEPGQLWCLVLWRDGDEERATLLPMRPTSVLTRGSA